MRSKSISIFGTKRLMLVQSHEKTQQSACTSIPKVGPQSILLDEEPIMVNTRSKSKSQHGKPSTSLISSLDEELEENKERGETRLSLSVAELSKLLQGSNASSRSRASGSSRSNSLDKNHSTFWDEALSIFEDVSIGFVSWLCCASLSFLGVSAAILLFYPSSPSPDNTTVSEEVIQDQPNWILRVPRKSPALTCSNLISVPDEYEKENEVFKHVLNISENSLIPSKEDLVIALEAQVLYASRVHLVLVDQYSVYSGFLYETIRDLDRIKNLTEDGVPSSLVIEDGKDSSFFNYETIRQWLAMVAIPESWKHSYFPHEPKFRYLDPFWGPTYSELILYQYQHFLESQPINYHTGRPIALSINQTTEPDIRRQQNCAKMNETIMQDKEDLRRRPQTQGVKEQRKILERIENELKEPCSNSSSKALETFAAIWKQFNGVMNECAKDATALKIFVKPFETYFGSSKEQKKALWNLKLLEMVGMSAERAKKRLQELV